MTNLEALKANLSGAHGIPISENAFLKALIDQSVTSTSMYTTADEKNIDLATIRIYKQILAGASLSDNGVSYSVPDKAAIKACMILIWDKWSLAHEEPNTLTAVSKW
jgi:hypothetical protein